MIESVFEERFWVVDGDRLHCQIALDRKLLEDPEHISQSARHAIFVMAHQAKEAGRKLRPLTVSVEYDAAYLTHVLRVVEA